MIFVFFLLFTPFHAFADNEECSAVNLRSPLLGHAWNKGNTPYCYAYSAADLISQRIGKKVSPLDIALNKNKKKWEQFVSNPNLNNFRETDIVGGSAVGAMQETQKVGGFCLEENFRSELKTNPENLKKELNNIQNDGPISARENLQDPRIIEKLCQNNTSLEELFPMLSFMQKIQLRLTSSPYNILRKLQEASCKNRIATNFKFNEYYNAEAPDKEKIMRTLDQELNKSNMITLYYDANFLLKKPLENASHASTIVARRKNPATKKCEYLIRNSWGECELNHYPYECKDGYIWVDKKVISANALGYAYIK